MNKPVLLDLFCGAGGATRGYQQAGFYVVGVDWRPQPRYVGDAFIQADALEYARTHGELYDAIHASPPCQRHSALRRVHKDDPDYKARHIDLIPETYALLQSLNRPYVIENVIGAPLDNAIVLCGAAFGLKVYRHRLFESNKLLLAIPHTPHRDHTPRAGGGISPKGFISIAGNGGGKIDGMKGVPPGWKWLDYARFAMGIDWMNRKELSQAIPPAFTHFIGLQLKKWC